MRNRVTLRISKPCSLAWEDLKGTGPQRDCQHCQSTVHDLSGLTFEEIARLVDANPSGFCARYFSAPGEAFVIEQVGSGRRPAPTAAAVVLASTLAACGSHESRESAAPTPSPSSGVERAAVEGMAGRAPIAMSSPTPAPTLTLEQCERLASLGYVDCSALERPKPRR